MTAIHNQLGNNLVYVTGFHGMAVTYNPAGPSFLNTLTHLERGYGYWVRVLQNDTLVLQGEPQSAIQKPALNTGWNLSAYIPEAPSTPFQLVQEISSSGMS